MDFFRLRSSPHEDGHVEVHFEPNVARVEYTKKEILHEGRIAAAGVHEWSIEARDMVRRALLRLGRYHARNGYRANPLVLELEEAS